MHITDWTSASSVEPYHVMEHVWACGNAVFGEGTEAAGTWVKQKETLLWEGGLPAIDRVAGAGA